jgi:signal transduction histidine kinase
VRLRAKLAVVFVSSLAATVLLVGAVDTNRTMKSMVRDLTDSSSILLKESTEQATIALSDTSGDPIDILRHDPALSASLRSAEVFGNSVKYIRFETPDGRLIVGTPINGLGRSTLPFEDLRRLTQPWPFFWRLQILSRPHTYELSKPLLKEDRVLCVIRMGLSTATIASAVQRKLIDFGILAASVTIVGMLAAMFSGALVLSPLGDVIRGIERLTTGNIGSSNLDATSGDELNKLALRFNQLSLRVKSDRARWEDERGQFINAFRSIADAVLLLDADESIRFCNEEALTRLGLPGGGLAQGKTLRVLLGENHPLVTIVSTAKTSTTEFRDVAAEVGRGQSKLSFLASIFPLGVDPSGAGQLVIVRDLKPVRQLDDVIDTSGRLARLGGLISGVAHQIRNPLNAMTLELELLSQDVRDGKEVEERVQTVRNDMLQLAKAIDALARFMRPETLKHELVPVNELIYEAAKLVVDPSIEVAFRLDPSNPVIRVDRAVLMEALRNLVQNSIEAMPQGGKLKLNTERKDNYVHISVSDSGHGIPPEIRDRVMQLYFTTKKFGTGLGLPMALRAIDLHNGTLVPDFRDEVGTEFKICLPAERAA